MTPNRSEYEEAMAVAVRIARRARRLLDPDEAEAIALLAVAQAARRWRGVGTLSGFAQVWVRGAILREEHRERRRRRAVDDSPEAKAFVNGDSDAVGPIASTSCPERALLAREVAEIVARWPRMAAAVAGIADEETQATVGSELGVTRQRARQLLMDARAMVVAAA